jgi:hypothetical protein
MHYMRIRRHGHADVTRIWGRPEDYYTAGDSESCWIWQGSLNAYGYGRYGNPVQMAHRIVYERYKGAIPDGLVLDHLCRTTACVNPAHLQPVPQGENIARGLQGYPLRSLCRNGMHDITEPEAWYVNSKGARTCLECKRANDRRGEAKRTPRKRR